MAVLVTGGYGMIGGWVTHELAQQGKRVIISSRSRHNVSYLRGFEDRIEFFKADLFDYASVFRLFKEYGGDIEGIIHIAGLMGGPYFATNPHFHIRTNTMGTVDLLEAARIFGIRKCVYCSSGSVYGPRNDIPDEDEPMAPGDLYGAAKASAELFGLQYANEFDVDFRAVRVFFGYGPGVMPSDMYPLYSAIFGCLEGKTEIRLEAGADQSIDFTYLKDIAHGMVLVYEADRLEHRQFNLTSGVCYPIPELIHRVCEVAGISADVQVGPGRIMPRGPSLDSTRLRESLGFEPQYGLDEGVKEYQKWIQQTLKK